MTYTQADLDMAERHVLQGEDHIRKQKAIVAKLSADGQDTALAEQLLAEFEQSLEMHRTHRDQIQAQLHAPPRPD